MTSITIIAIALALLIAGVLIAAIILTVGHQSTERRPGFVHEPSSRARAEVPLEEELEQLRLRKAIAGAPSGAALAERLHEHELGGDAA